MNEQTTKLIEQLAAKLGTTAEYLWSVLVNQAYVSGIRSVIFICIFLAIQVALFKFYNVIRAKITTAREEDRYSDFADISGPILLVFTCITGVLLLGFQIASMSNAFTAFLNPEFWALSYILEQM